MLKKLILISAILLANSHVLYAEEVTRSTVAATTTVSSQRANMQRANKPQKVQAQVAIASPDAAPSRPRSSYYTGIGVSVLSDRGYTGLMPKIFLGYGSLANHSNLYGAAEIFVGAKSIALSPNQFYRVTSVAGASVMPGYKWNDWTLIFARFGFESVYYSKLRTTKFGGLVGIGFQTYVSDHWDFRGEYDYANNKNLNQYNIDLIYLFC